jgi:adenine deaminase
MATTHELIRVARGELNADLVLRNARVVNTLAGCIEEGDVAIHGGLIAGVGHYEQARECVDLEGSFLLPGLIDGHTHIESSMLHPARYAEAVVPRGTLTLVTDLHEIANACGVEGIEFVVRWSHRLPLDMRFMAPSCVPATPLETSGAELGPDAIRRLLSRPDFIGLGEVMNYPGVLAGFQDVLDKLQAARGRPIDGHAPGLTGADLNAYVAAGMMSDHECTTREEAEEKLRKGMYLMLREGSSEKNLEALLPRSRTIRVIAACSWWTTGLPPTSPARAISTTWSAGQWNSAWSRSVPSSSPPATPRTTSVSSIGAPSPQGRSPTS